MDIVVAIILGAVGSLIAAEVYANGSVIADAIIRRAVLRLPEHERSRFLEEWRADNDDFPGNGQKVFHSIGCFFGASAVAKALARPQARKGASENQKLNPPTVDQTDARGKNNGTIQVGKYVKFQLEIDEEIEKRIAEFTVLSKTNLTRAYMRQTLDYIRWATLHNRNEDTLQSRDEMLRELTHKIEELKKLKD